MLDLRDDDPRLHDTTSDLLAASVEAEAELELVTRVDRERCPTSPSHVGALRLILGQLEVAYRTIDVAVKEAIESTASLLTRPIAVPRRRRRQRLARPFLVQNPLHKSDVFRQGAFLSSFIFFLLKHHAPINAG